MFCPDITVMVGWALKINYLSIFVFDRSWIPLSQVFLMSKEVPTVMKNKKGGFALALAEMEEHIKMIK